MTRQKDCLVLKDTCLLWKSCKCPGTLCLWVGWCCHSIHIFKDGRGYNCNDVPLTMILISYVVSVFCFQVFYRPMVKMSVMSKQYINQLFPNLDALIKIHGKWAKPIWFVGHNVTMDNSLNPIQTGEGAFRTPLRQNRDNSYTERAMTFKFSDFS